MTAAVAAVLFDLDGTLLDTAPDMVGALNALRTEHDLAPLPYDAVRAAVSHGAARVVKIGFPDTDAAAAAALAAAFFGYLSRAPQPAHAALSRHGRGAGGARPPRFEIRHRHQQAGVAHRTAARGAQLLRARFECVVSGDTVAERKPHPLPLLHAAELAGVAAGGMCLCGRRRTRRAGRPRGRHAGPGRKLRLPARR